MKTKSEKFKFTDKPIENTLPVSDNLGLSKVFVEDVPNDIIFPDELNRFLRDQIQYLTHHNGMLEKNLSEVELKLQQSTSKINVLSTELEEYQAACPKNGIGGVTTANFASSKIVELSKKLRERNSEVEVYKTKCSKLKQQILDIETKEKEINRPKPEVVEKPKNELEEQVKSLQEKLNTANTKLFEVKNCNVSLKNDLKMANKLLQQEVGENFETIQNSNGTWRGRAQVIRDLQQKNSDLREKLRCYQDGEGNKARSENINSQVIKLSSKVEGLTKENSELKESVQEFKRKFEASKARNKVLETDYSTIRIKMNKVMDENEQNREVIASLTNRVVRAQDLQNEAVHQKQKVIEKLENDKKILQMENSRKSVKIENFQTQLEELKRECDRQKEKNKTKQPLSPGGDPQTDLKYRVNYEAERLRLLELTKISSKRLDQERAAHANTHAQYRSERQKVAKLESKVARLQLDQKTDRSKDRLELAQETIKALDTRLQIERQERQLDMEQFTQILSASQCIHNSCSQIQT